jgi:alkyl sulfatase BDS1-like metallo-beta-lactamase superfamily hydrolase
MAQFGVLLPPEGEDANSADTEVKPGGESAYVEPTHPIESAEEELIIQGVRLRFYTSYSFDTNDCLIIWLPEDSTVIHNHMSDNFPNLYSIGGGPFRDPLPWIAGLDVIRGLKPEYLAGCHGRPVVGAAVVEDAVTANRDALQFLFDQTVRGMNLGLGPEDTAAFVKLPSHLACHPRLSQTYGEAWHHVRSIYAGLIGWYSGNAVELGGLLPAEEARHIIDGFGGVKAALQNAREAMERTEAAWAAKLAYWIVLAADSVEAREILAAALRYLGQRTTAWSTRNACLIQALEWEGKIDRRTHNRSPDSRALLGGPDAGLVEPLRYRIDPERAGDTNITVQLTFSDSGNTFGLTIRNGLLQITKGSPESADLVLQTTRNQWTSILTSEADPSEMGSDGARFFGFFDYPGIWGVSERSEK